MLLALSHLAQLEAYILWVVCCMLVTRRTFLSFSSWLLFFLNAVACLKLCFSPEVLHSKLPVAKPVTLCRSATRAVHKVVLYRCPQEDPNKVVVFLNRQSIVPWAPQHLIYAGLPLQKRSFLALHSSSPHNLSWE